MRFRHREELLGSGFLTSLLSDSIQAMFTLLVDSEPETRHSASTTLVALFLSMRWRTSSPSAAKLIGQLWRLMQGGEVVGEKVKGDGP